MSHATSDAVATIVPRRIKVSRSFWMIASTIAAAIVIFLLVNPQQLGSQTKSTPSAPIEPEPPVRVVGPATIALSADTPLREQLTIVKTKKTRVGFAQLVVTGSISARVRPGKGTLEDRWQFATPELSTTFADWVRAKSELEFADGQYRKSKELAAAQNEHLESIVKRLEPLNQGALVAASQFKQAEADLLKSQIQGEKDVFAALSNLRTAQKHKAALERDLSQAGIEPNVFAHAVDNMVLVVANVPESHISEVSEQQGCEVRFYGYPDRTFPGHVESLGSAVTPARRTLRVLFELNDKEDVLKPGMFGEVGLGTDARDTVLIPPAALLHVGRGDYVLMNGERPNEWRVVEVKLGELHDGMFEVLSRLPADHDLITDGAILLKPSAVEALTQPAAKPTPP